MKNLIFITIWFFTDLFKNNKDFGTLPKKRYPDALNLMHF